VNSLLVYNSVLSTFLGGKKACPSLAQVLREDLGKLYSSIMAGMQNHDLTIRESDAVNQRLAVILDGVYRLKN